VAYTKIFKKPNVDAVTLMKEIEILERLKDEHILTVYDHWQDNDCYVFTTELLTYTLREFVHKTNGVAIGVITDWCKQILKGLNYLHSENEDKGTIIHRDIRLDNLFYIHNGGVGQIKIGDLGLATLQKPEPKSAKAPSVYAAPEFYSSMYNEKVDIWSFGMSVIEMVTLKEPYTGHTTDLSFIQAVTNGIKPKELFFINDDLVLEFIAHCLEMEPEQRYSAIQLMDQPFITNTDEKRTREFFTHRTQDEVELRYKEFGASKEGWDIYISNHLGMVYETTLI